MNCRNNFCRSNYYSLLLGLLSIFLLAVCKQTAASHAVIADNAGSATESVGAISATFSVNQQGAANYLIPLNAAPGVNGLNPELNLSYNSQGNDGLFGHGWSLSGLSAITRCSITRDGHRYPVTYGAEDRFCLDSQYLIPVSGEYGEEGTIYHTERESWLRIQAFYQINGEYCGSGPCYFVATINHGSQITYGGTNDSRIEAVLGNNVTTIPSGSVRVWTVNQHVDLNKNVIEYHYNEDTTSGEYTPSVILYGGNQTAGQQPQRAIELAFDDAASTTVRYQGGAQVVQSKKINTITSCIADTPIENCSTSPTPQGFSKVATYSLDVAFNAMSQLHYLQSLQLNGADGSSLPATTFNYSAAQSGPLSFEPAVNWTSFFSQNNGWGLSCQARTMADINGDGRFDIIGFGSNYTEFALSEGTPISSPDVLCMAGEEYNSGCSPDSRYFSCNSGFDADTPRMMGDVNGDGLFDIISLGGNNIHVAISKGTSFQQQTNWGDFLVKNDGWDQYNLRTLADINGDGLSDAIGFGNTTTQFGLSTGTAFTKGPVLRSFFSKDQGFSIKDGNPPMLGDVNGDGLIDVVGIKKDQGTRKAYVGLSQGSTFASKAIWNDDLSIDGKPASLQAGRNPIVLLDLNNDRLADLVFFGDENVYVSLSTGASFSTPAIWNSTNFTYDNGGWNDSSSPGGTLRTFADINGDGKQDLIGFGTQAVQFGINTGSSFVVDSTLFAPITDEFIYQSMGYLQTNPRFPVDMIGDGISDLFGLGSNNAIVAVAPRSQALLTSVVDGLGKKIEICYQSISGSASDVVGKCTDKDSTYQVYSTLDTSEFNPDDMKWCEGRCREYNSPTFVVKSQTIKNGAADNKGYRYEYSYAGELISRDGYGLLGFRRSSETDLQVNMSAAKPGLEYISYFRQAFPFKGQLDTMKMVRVSDGRLLGQTDYEYLVTDPKAGVHTYLVQIKQQTTRHLGTQGNASYSIGKTLIYDDYGNIKLLGELGNIEEPSDDLYKKVSYENDVANWRLGYPVDVWLCPTSACDQVLNHEQRAYDDQRNMLYTRTYDDTNNVWLGSEFSKYDDFGNVLSINEAWWNNSGNKQDTFNPVSIAYDSTFNTYPASRTNVLQQVSTSVYDARFGLQKQVTDINGNSVIVDYDGFSRLQVLYGPNAQGDKTLLEQYEYGVLNNEMYRKVINTIDWNGTTAWDTDYFDALGRTYRKESEATSGTIVQLTCYLSQTQIKQFSLPYYEVNKGDTCESNSAAYWTEYQYDSLQRPKQITHTDQSISQIVYTIQELDNYNRDYVQRTDSVDLPEQRTIASYLNPDNAVLKRIFPNQNGVSQEQAVVNQYDHLGRTKQTVSPGGAITSSVYDSLNRVVSVNNSDSGAITWTYYQQNGLLKSVVDASGTTQNYTQYDPILRLQTKQYVKDGETRTIQYTYDASQPDCYNLGNLTAVDDTQGMKHSYCYDALGNNVYSELDLTNEGVSYTIAAQYDPLGGLTRFTYPDGDYMQRAYNIEGPLNQVNLCDKGSSNCTQYAAWKNFSATGHPANLNYLNGVDSNYTYYPSTGHIKTLNAQTTSNNALLNKAYTWNTLGLLTAVKDNLNADYSMTFTPDPAGSIKKAVIGQSSGQLSLDYAYNVAGALTQKGETQYTRYTGQKLMNSETGGKSTSYNYYANAFLKNKTTGNTQWDYTYNGQNRLSSVKKAVGQDMTEANYVYDYSGSLIKRVDSEGITSYYINKNYDITVYQDRKDAIYTKTLGSLTNTVATVSSSGAFASQTFAYDPAQPASKSVVETSTSASANGLNESTALPSDTVSPESGLQGDGYPVAGNTLFFHSDQIGSTTLVTDTEGQEVTRVTYLPFGDIYQQLSSGPNDFRAKFAGRELNEDVGLYYFGARFYDPSIGQFIQADNRVLGGPDILASSYNRFAYAGNNPVTYTDPSGHSFGSFMKKLGISAGIMIGGTMIGQHTSMAIGVSLIGASWGGQATNQTLNPLKWDWKSGKTYGGLAAGIAVAQVGVALSVVAPAVAAAGASKVTVLLAGLGTATLDGFVQNATYSALDGGNIQQVLTAGVEGAALGAATQVMGDVGEEIGSRVTSAVRKTSKKSASFGRDFAGEGVDSIGRGCSASFVAGTSVNTMHGLKPIEDIALYDLVLAYDETTGESGTFLVTAEFTRTAPDYIVLTVGDEVLKTTTEHPFLVVGKGWINAKKLQIGSLLQTKSGIAVDVKQLEYRNKPVTVHNFTVDEVHNYYVTRREILVHNIPCNPSKPTTDTLATEADFEGIRDQRQIRRTDLERLIPEGTSDTWGAGQRTSGGGFKFEWEPNSQNNNFNWEVHAHAPDNGAPASSKSRTMWIVRVRHGTRWLYEEAFQANQKSPELNWGGAKNR